MKISEFIRSEIFAPRLQPSGVLVVYDPAKCYRELSLDLASDTLRVVDASQSSISAREEAQATFRELGRPGTLLAGMLIYVPAKPPVSDEDRQRDPFALYTVCGNIFPEGDGDEFMNICLKAKPDQATEIRRIFHENPQPSFAVIDAIAGGSGWPTLQALLGVESARDILFALLAPSDHQKHALAEQEAWVAEARDLFQSCLGLKLLTRGKTWATISEELWRFVLFSEFAFDLPEPLPETLAKVPRAIEEARPMVEDLCDRSRNDRRTQSTYIDRAQSIEKDLNLPAYCAEIQDLGLRDTFPFEESSFLRRAMANLERDDVDAVREIIKSHAHSVWVGIGESQVRWALIRAALRISEMCDDLERQLPQHCRNLDDLIEFYLKHLREADRLHREFEQTLGDDFDAATELGRVIEMVRGRYRRLAAKAQDVFIRQLEKTGWPSVGRLSNGDVFDKFVAPSLQDSGRRVAYILVDALRYELGVALEALLTEAGPAELHAACAQLPTVTNVGMASLLPEAASRLELKREGEGVLPALGDVRLVNVSIRMEMLRQRYGDRFAEMKLVDFIRSRKDLAGSVDLLVLRSGEIDTQLETSPETALGQIQDTLKRIRVAVHKLKEKGFQRVVIATDHGFVLNPQIEAGDVCAKPPGVWINVHDRFLLGAGSADTANCLLPTAHLGIRGEFSHAAFPRGLVPYRAGQQYFHGGVSLQEALVPVLTLRLEAVQLAGFTPKVEIVYKSGTSRITTRLPVITVIVQADLIHPAAEVEILLEAQDKKGNTVGEAKAGGPVNPATGTITIPLGQRVPVTLRMQDEFEGKFTVVALNPTTMAVYARKELETDYTV